MTCESNRLPSKTVGDTITLTGRYKPSGVTAAITNNIIITFVAKTLDGTVHNLTVIPNPDQVNNTGVFEVSGDTTDWFAGDVKVTGKITVTGLTGALSETRDTTTSLYFDLVSG